MPKTDYTRVETALEEGLRHFNILQLLDYADYAAKIGTGDPKQRERRLRSIALWVRRKHERRITAATVKYDIDRLFKKDYHLYTALGTYHDEIEDLLKRAADLSDEEWERFEAIKAALEKYKEEHAIITPNSEIVDKERRRHINKRFNTNEKWLPLH